LLCLLALQGAPTYSVAFDVKPDGMGAKSIMEGTINNPNGDDFVYKTDDPNAVRAEVTILIYRYGKNIEKVKVKNAGIKGGYINGWQPPLTAQDEVRCIVSWYDANGKKLRTRSAYDGNPHQPGT